MLISETMYKFKENRLRYLTPFNADIAMRDRILFSQHRKEFVVEVNFSPIRSENNHMINLFHGEATEKKILSDLLLKYNEENKKTLYEYLLELGAENSFSPFLFNLLTLEKIKLQDFFIEIPEDESKVVFRVDGFQYYYAFHSPENVFSEYELSVWAKYFMFTKRIPLKVSGSSKETNFGKILCRTLALNNEPSIKVQERIRDIKIKKQFLNAQHSDNGRVGVIGPEDDGISISRLHKLFESTISGENKK